MKLYTSFGPNPFVLNAFLLERGLTLETHMLDGMKGESRQAPYVEWNPAGTTPFLELDDGTYLAESTAICEYLDEISPGPTLVGSDPVERAQTRMWMRRVDLAFVQTSSTAWRFAEGNAYVRHLMHTAPHAADDFKRIAADGLAWIDRAAGSGDYLCGARLSLADILLYVFVEAAQVNNQAASPDLLWIAAWRARMAARPLARAVTFGPPPAH